MKKFILTILLLTMCVSAQAEETVGVAETITHGHIILTNHPCEGIGGSQYITLDAFGNLVSAGCWVWGTGTETKHPRLDIITAIDQSTMERIRWNKSDFKLHQPASKWLK